MRAAWTNELVFFQSAHEGEIVAKLEEAEAEGVGVILNAAAYTHTSIAIRDCLEAMRIPKIEVHLSNPDAREDFRKTNYIRAVMNGHVCGFGWYGYMLSLEAMKHLIDNNKEGSLNV